MQHLQPNTTLQGGKYRIERVLGQGGFGITYLAVQTSLNRKVAIKEFFMEDYCNRDEVTMTMQSPSTGSSKLAELYKKKFVKEARNLARLKHPNIISVIDVFEENGTVYYTMPYMVGGSLLNYVEKHGTLSETMAMKYIRQIAYALKYMHEVEHICHFDVKPANILIDEKGDAVLIDFGISKNYDSTGHETTSTPIGVSDGYAPIEQYQQNIEDFSPISDVYALGATLYFLLHGKRPVSAVQRAGGTDLPMSQQLSPYIKDVINASMKISKRERANSVDIFLGRVSSPIVNSTSTESNSNSLIGWIIGIAVIAVIGFFIYNNQVGTDNSSNVISNDNAVEAPAPSIEQSLETATDIYKDRVEQFVKKQKGVIASYPNDKRYCAYFSKEDEYGRKFLYRYDAIADKSEKMDLPIEATAGDYTDLWITKGRFIFVAAEYRYTDFIRIDTQTNQINYITNGSSVKRTSSGFTVVKSECINEYTATCEAEKEYAYTDYYYNDEGINTGQGQRYR